MFQVNSRSPKAVESSSNADRLDIHGGGCVPMWLTAELCDAATVSGWRPSCMLIEWIIAAYSEVAAKHAKPKDTKEAWTEFVGLHGLRFPNFPSSVQREVLMEAVAAFTTASIPLRSQEEVHGIPFRRVSTWSRTGVTAPVVRTLPSPPKAAYPPMTEFRGRPLPGLGSSFTAPRSTLDQDEVLLKLLSVMAPDDDSAVFFFLTVTTLAVKDLHTALGRVDEHARIPGAVQAGVKERALLIETLRGCDLARAKTLALATRLGVTI